MPAPRVQSLDIVINGILSPSVQAAILKTEQQLKAMGASVKNTNYAMAQVFKAAYQPPAEIQKSIDKISKYQEVMGNITQMGASFAVGNYLVEGLDLAISKAEQLGEFMKESGIKAATMEQMQTQLLTQMPKGTTAKQVEDLTNTLQYFADTTPFRLGKVFDSFRELLVARVGVTGLDPRTGEYQSANIPQVMEVIKEIGEIASATTRPGMDPSEHYASIATAIQQSLLGGNLMERTLRPLEQMGLEIRPWLEQHYKLVEGSLGPLGSDEDTAALHDLYKMIKKGQVPAVSILDYLKDVAGAGGKYSGSIASHSTLAITGWSTLLDKAENIMRGLGKLELGPFEQLINKINSSFTKETYLAMMGTFDKLAASVNESFKPLMATLVKADWDRIGKDALMAMDAFEKMFQKAQPIFQWLAKDLPDEIRGLIAVTTAVERVAIVIEKAFGWAINFGGKVGAATSVTPSDRLANAQDRLSALQGAGATDDQIIAAKKELMDAEKAQKDSLENLKKATDKVSGNDLVHLNYAIEDSTAALLRFAASFPNGTGTGGSGGVAGLKFGLSSGAGSNLPFTLFGPGRPEDQPGQPDYDRDSFNHLGHIHGVPYSLSAGDAAMHADYAEKHYGIKPGQTYRSDKDGKLHRWRDTSGARNPSNEDIFVDKPGASINYSPTYHLNLVDGEGVRRILDEHGREFHKYLARLAGLDNERSFVI
jgi:hypothetical protein